MMLYICTALYIIHNIYRKGKREGKKEKELFAWAIFVSLGKKVCKYVVPCLDDRLGSITITKGSGQELCNEQQI